MISSNKELQSSPKNDRQDNAKEKQTQVVEEFMNYYIKDT